jgi:hypothetical protein
MINFKNTLKTTTVELLKQVFADGSNYLFLSGSEEFPETVPAVLSDTVNEEYLAYGDIISAFKIQPSEVSFVIKRKNWTLNKIYQEYTDDINLKNTDYYATTLSTNENILDVFICVENNKNSPSTIKPSIVTYPSKNLLYTSDGYVWRHIYRFVGALYNKFITDEYIPIEKNTTPYTSDNVTFGSVEKINITKTGKNFPYAVNLSKDNAYSIISIDSNNGVVCTLNNSFSDVSRIENFYSLNYTLYIIDPITKEVLNQFTVDTSIIQDNTLILTTCEDSSSFSYEGKTIQILPKISFFGNGVGLKLYPNLNINTKLIENIEILNPGEGYNELDIKTTNNYDFETVFTNSGGIGFNILNDLYCSDIMIAKTVNMANKDIYQKTPETLTISSQQLTYPKWNGAGNRTTAIVVGDFNDTKITQFGVIRSETNNTFQKNSDLVSLSGCDVITVYKGSDSANPLDVNSFTEFNVGDHICQTNASNDITAYGKIISITFFGLDNDLVVDAGFSNTQKQEFYLKGRRPKITVKTKYGTFLTTGGFLRKLNITTQETTESAWRIYSVTNNDINKNKGRIMYLENTNPVTFTTNSVFDYKIIISI